MLVCPCRPVSAASGTVGGVRSVGSPDEGDRAVLAMLPKHQSMCLHVAGCVQLPYTRCVAMQVSHGCCTA
eukprot:1619673-Lingulodinium_polyedra.AAC.1